MRLYLLRHGHSPSAAEARVSTDAERPLSARGREDAARAAKDLLKRGGKPSVILHSPLKRAVETAAAAAEALKPKGGTTVFLPLSNALPAEELYAALQPALAQGEVLAVGHQPQLGELACHLCGQIFDLMPAGLIALEIDGGGAAKLLWSRNP